MELPAAAEISGFPVQHMDELPTKWAFSVLPVRKKCTYLYDHLSGLLPTLHKGRGEYKGGISWNNLTCLKCNYI